MPIKIMLLYVTLINFYYKPGGSHHELVDILETVVKNAMVNTELERTRTLTSF